MLIVLPVKSFAKHKSESKIIIVDKIIIKSLKLNFIFIIFIKMSPNP